MRPTSRATVPLPFPCARTASIMRSPASVRPVAASAIIQCGKVKADRQSPMRASALSASSTQRWPTSTPWRSRRNSMEEAFWTSMYMSGSAWVSGEPMSRKPLS